MRHKYYEDYSPRDSRSTAWQDIKDHCGRLQTNKFLRKLLYSVEVFPGVKVHARTVQHLS